MYKSLRDFSDASKPAGYLDVPSRSVSGYEMTYWREKKGKRRIVTVPEWKNNKVILKKLKSGKYRIKVRNYAERNGKKYYSKYSKVYKFKI